MKKAKKQRPSPSRNTSKPTVFAPAKSATVENKLNETALLLNYLFEYGVDFKHRIINMTGEIEQFTWDVFDIAMTEMESQSKADITVKIASEGGSTYYAMAIVGRIKESKCKVITKGYGHVMSAATLILASGTRKRLISEEAFFMWHESSYELSGRHSENTATVRQVEREEKLWCDKMAKYSNKDAKFWKKNGTGVDAYFDANELVEMGIADEVF